MKDERTALYQSAFMTCIALFIASVCAGSGLLSFLETHEDTTNFDYRKAVVVTADGQFVISTGLMGHITTQSRDSETGALTFVEHINAAGGSDAALSPDDKHLYVTTGYGSSIIAYSRNLATGALTLVDTYQDGAGNIDGLDLAISVAVSPDGAHVYATGATDNGLVVFSRDSGTGELSYVETHFDDGTGNIGLDNPRDVTVSPDGAHVYVAGTGDDSIVVYSRDSVTGALTWQGKVTDGVNGVSGINNVYEVIVSPDGAHVYGGGGSIGGFSRDPATGLLTSVESETIYFSRGLAFDPSGTFLLVTSETGDNLTLLQRDSSTGLLEVVDTATEGANGVTGMQTPTSVAVDPKGQAVYVGTEYDSVTVFQLGFFTDGFEDGSTDEWSASSIAAP